MWHLYSILDNKRYYLVCVLDQEHIAAFIAVYRAYYPQAKFEAVSTQVKACGGAYDFAKAYRAKFFLNEVINAG
jgi:hypothetical protein